MLGLITGAVASFPDWAWARAHRGDCREGAQWVLNVPWHQDRLCPVLTLRLLCGPIPLFPFHGIPKAGQNGLDESGWARRVSWSACSDDISKTKFRVGASWPSLSAQNGLFVTWQLPWSLRTSIKAVFRPPLCNFFPFCNHVWLFFQRQGKKLSFTAHTWTTELTLSSRRRKITWQNQRVYPKSCLWKKDFDTVWLFFFLRAEIFFFLCAETLFQFQKTLYFVFILFLLCILVNKHPVFGTDFSLCLSWQLNSPYSSDPEPCFTVWCCSVM